MCTGVKSYVGKNENLDLLRFLQIKLIKKKKPN